MILKRLQSRKYHLKKKQHYTQIFGSQQKIPNSKTFIKITKKFYKFNVNCSPLCREQATILLLTRKLYGFRIYCLILVSILQKMFQAPKIYGFGTRLQNLIGVQNTDLQSFRLFFFLRKSQKFYLNLLFSNTDIC